MGYRNDVRICIKEENYYTLRERAEREGFAAPKCLLDEKSMSVLHFFRDGTVIFGWNEIKWEDYFIDVKFIMNFLDEMANEGYPYAFVRMEEDGYDEEIFSDGDDGEDYTCRKIGIRREIFIKSDDED